MTLFPAQRNAAERLSGLGGTELRRRGPAAPTRTEEVGGDDVRWPVVDLGIIILLSSGPGFAGLFGPNTTLVLGLMSASALLYSLNTWLPELMRRNGFGQTASLAFLIFSNGGGVFGALVGSRQVDRFGPKLSRRLPRAS